ncbi:hypothetical protein PMAYCL1PPCAC_05974, partial [Pristionchus mayeri]
SYMLSSAALSAHLGIVPVAHAQRHEISYDFSVPSPTSSVVLVVSGRKIHVSKEILAVSSPVFTSLFYGESANQSKKEFEINDVGYNTFIEYLLCIYPSTFELTDRVVEGVLLLA